MNDFQAEKQLVRSYHAALDQAEGAGITACMTAHAAPDFTWRGYFPFDTLGSAREVGETFWRPLRGALTRLQRRADIFFAGQNEIDGFQGVWVVEMGHLMGLFDAPWLGIPPTGKMAFLRYCTFHRVTDGRIAETAMYFDIPHLMRQAGLRPFPPQTAAELVQPGPMPHDGLLHDAQPGTEGAATLALINRMITDLGQWQHDLPIEQELALTWANDMIWWGPSGIGASYTIERYAKQHAGPFRAGFSHRAKTSHIARLAEGNYGGFFGWPNFTAAPVGGFMGMPGTHVPGEFRVIDIYRRDGDRLAENWVFIDLLHFWKGQGVDILARTTEIG